MVRRSEFGLNKGLGHVLGGALVAGAVLLGGLTLPAHAVEPDAPETLITRLDAVMLGVQEKLSEKFRGEPRFLKRDHGALVQFYTEHSEKPVWVDETGLNARAKQAIAAFQRADEWGLKPSDYAYPKPAELTGPAGTEPPTIKQLVAAEIKMSHAVLRYARHAAAGRLVPRLVSRSLDHKPPYPEPLSVMEAVIEATDVATYLESLHPPHPQFQALRKRLLALKAEGKTKELPVIPPGRVLKPGMVDPQVPLIRTRLGLSVPMRDGKPVFSPNVYDSALEMAVKAFQKANGLRAEGYVGKATRRALNRRPKDPKTLILVNMEKWRWMPRDLGRFHIRANVPEFIVRVVRDGEVIHKERMIVGKPTNKTPIFSDEMETVVFNPYWNVPQSIIIKEMGGQVPKGFEGRMVGGRLFVRQPPGPRNALGKVKFLFPNRHAVYMHDTPAKSLFRRSVRAFSHGCMRIRNPKRLAEIVLTSSADWSLSRVNQAWRSRANRGVNLKRKIPVHVTYFTAWVEEDGKMRTFRDIYGHDRRIAYALKHGYSRRERVRNVAAKSRPRPVRRVNYQRNKPDNPFANFFQSLGN